MNNRVFICADRRFPHGDAGGNRIEYYAKALQLYGYDVFIISIGKNDENLWYDELSCYIYSGLKYKNVKLNQGKRGKVDIYLTSGKKTIEILKEQNLATDDKIIIYTSNFIYAMPIKHLAEKKGAHIIYDIVEWFDYKTYKYKQLDPRYWAFEICFKKIYPSSKNVIVISENLKNHFESQKCNTFLLPIVVDTQEHNRKISKSDNKIRLIYPGNPEHKDNIWVVLKAFDSLSDSQKQRFEIHFTSVNKKKISDLLIENSNLIDKNEQFIEFHSWMEFDELLELYHKMDFLVLAREKNTVTTSNFPSKIPELMSCGVSVIANDVGDFPSYLSNGKDSLIYKKCDPCELCDIFMKISKMSNDEILALRSNAMLTATEKFDYRKWSDKFGRYIEEIGNE